ncbi:MAG: tRNA-intron lyase [Promethearchaeota archaeon]
MNQKKETIENNKNNKWIKNSKENKEEKDNLNLKDIKNNNDKTADEKQIKYVHIPVFNKVHGKLFESSIIVFDYYEASFLYSGGRYFGKPIGVRKPKGNKFYKRPLELSLLEGYYLMEKGKIEIYDPISKSNISLELLRNKGQEYYNNFEDKYEVFKYLRDKGYIVRPGLKFGADFAIYKKGPGIDHSPYIMKILPKNTMISALDIVRAGRLANSVKKKFIIASAKTNNYFGFQWYKP